MLDRNALTEAEAARYLSVSRSALRQGRMDGNRQGRMPVPPHIKVGRKVLYLVRDLDRWLEEHRVVPAKAGAA